MPVCHYTAFPFFLFVAGFLKVIKTFTTDFVLNLLWPCLAALQTVKVAVAVNTV